MTTQRLYYADSRLTSFQAVVVGQDESGRRVYLDQTAFYPTSGGQPHDVGLLGGVAVVDVVDEGARVAHVLDGPLTAREVGGVIDWARRFDHMQQHTGQHLLSAVFADLFGYETLSVHFGADSATIDLDVPVVPAGEVRRAEARANSLVTANHAVRVAFEDAATAEGLRKASMREGPLRIVTIEGVDRSACGGTHVDATGEVGPILLRRQERVKQGARIEFTCGLRAVTRSREEYESLARMAQSLSASVRDLPTLVEAQASELKAMAAVQRRHEEDLARYQAAERHAATAVDRDGNRRLVQRRPAGLEQVRPLALAFASLPRAVFIALCEDPPSILVATSADSGVEAGPWLKSRLAEVAGRGGGSSRLAQGSVPSGEALDALATRLEAEGAA